MKINALSQGRDASDHELIPLHSAEFVLVIPQVPRKWPFTVVLEYADGTISGQRAHETKRRGGQVNCLVRAIISRQHISNAVSHSKVAVKPSSR